MKRERGERKECVNFGVCGRCEGGEAVCWRCCMLAKRETVPTAQLGVERCITRGKADIDVVLDKTNLL